MEKQLSISVDLANAIAQYLGRQPYQEVAQLISELAKLQPIAAPKSEK